MAKEENLDPEIDELRVLAMSKDVAIDLRNLVRLRGALRSAAGVVDEQPALEAAVLRNLLVKVVAAAHVALDVKDFLQLNDRKQLRGRPETFIAAAGECLRLTSRETDRLPAIVATMKGIDQVKAQPEITKPLREKGARDMRAAIWLGSTSAKTGHLRIGDSMKALRSALYRWLNDDRVLAEISTGLAAADDSRRLVDTPDGDQSSSAPKEFSVRFPPPDYVRREAIERQFNDLVAQGTKLIVFVGQAGMGKTMAATALASSQPGRVSPPIIRFDDGKPRPVDVTAALHHCGLDASREGGAANRLAALMCTDGGPNVVVLDNFDSTDELVQVLPYQTRSIVVATCRTLGAATFDGGIVEVATMTEGEAIDQVRRLRPQLDHQAATLLAQAMHYYPLGIQYACGLLRTTNVSLPDLFHSIRNRPGSIRTREGETLRVVLARLIQSIEAKDSVAMSMLCCVVFSSTPPGLEEDLIQATIRAIIGSSNAVAEHAAAIDLLTRCSLIQFEERPGSSPEPRNWRVVNPRDYVLFAINTDGFFGPLFALSNAVQCADMHPLTRTILRELLIGKAMALSRTIRSLFRLSAEAAAESVRNSDCPYQSEAENDFLLIFALWSRMSYVLEHYVETIPLCAGVDDYSEEVRLWKMETVDIFDSYIVCHPGFRSLSLSMYLWFGRGSWQASGVDTEWPGEQMPRLTTVLGLNEWLRGESRPSRRGIIDISIHPLEG